MNLTSITAAGRVGKDPTTRQAGTVPVTSFSLAVNKYRKKNSGAAETMWFNVEFWGENNTSKNVMEYVKKGVEVLVVGAFETNEYERDGKSYKDMVIRASAFQLPARGDGAAITPKDAATSAPAATKAATPVAEVDSSDDDEIPF